MQYTKVFSLCDKKQRVKRNKSKSRERISRTYWQSASLRPTHYASLNSARPLWRNRAAQTRAAGCRRTKGGLQSSCSDIAIPRSFLKSLYMAATWLRKHSPSVQPQRHSCSWLFSLLRSSPGLGAWRALHHRKRVRSYYLRPIQLPRRLLQSGSLLRHVFSVRQTWANTDVATTGGRYDQIVRKADPIYSVSWHPPCRRRARASSVRVSRYFSSALPRSSEPPGPSASYFG